MAVIREVRRAVSSSEDIVGVRKLCREWAVGSGFSLVDQTKMVTAASELARNLSRCGGVGTVHFEALNDGMKRGLRLVFEDDGPGIEDIERAMRARFTRRSAPALARG